MNRIPAYESGNPDGMLVWFAEMSNRGLLFHPEDDPANIIRIDGGEQLFSDGEADEIRRIIGRMDSEHGHEAMIDACYPVFMRAVGQRLDA